MRAVTDLSPDRGILARFVDLMFKNAKPDGVVSLRAFPDKKANGKKQEAIFVDGIRLNDPAFLDVVTERARQAATWDDPAVFAPPVALFKNHQNAKTENISESPGLSVECDRAPQAARSKLEALLGTATAIVASGGEWSSPDTGEIEPKLHLHWRLKTPTATEPEHKLLREARELATRLVDGDATNIAVVHPIRWPGSWHRKGTPKLADIVASSDNEIDLDDAIELLREAAGVRECKDAGLKTTGRLEASDHALVGVVLAHIPNGDDPKLYHWNFWNGIGMKTWAATTGSEIGRKAFHELSARSSKYDKAETDARWDHYATSPPTKAGFGSLVYLARQHSPGFKLPLQVDPKANTPPQPDANATNISLHDFYAYLPQHSYLFAPTGEMWVLSSVNSRLPKLPMLRADGSPVLDEDEKPKYHRPSDWLDKHRAVEQLSWAPGLPAVIKDQLIREGGWFEREGCHVFNLYRPPIPILRSNRSATPWLDHVHKIYPDDAEHIIRWLAHRVQRPQDKINHAVVLGGKQGIGKDTLLEPVKRAVGPWNFIETSPQNILGRFNGHLKSVILRISEARDLGEFDRFKFYDHTKNFIAAPPDVLRIDEKHLREFAIPNVVGAIITTNHKSDGIFLPPDDRRHYVAWSELDRHTFEPGYWDKLWKWYAEGGIDVVAHYLSTLDLSDFDPKAPPPQTPAFFEIVNASRTPEDAEMADALDVLERPDAVTIHHVSMASTSSDFVEFLKDRKNSRKIPHRFEACDYTPVRNPAAKDGLWVVKERRQVIYARSELSTGQRLAAANRLAAAMPVI